MKSQSSFKLNVQVGDVPKEPKAKGWEKIRRTIKPKTMLP